MYTFRSLSRKKLLTPPEVDKSSETSEALGIVELTSRGIGGAFGVALFILLEHTFRVLAGPAVLLSVLLAAFTAFLAGLCFAELGGRIPEAGSAYVYSYMTVGEFIAFLTGWSMILRSITGCAFIARGLTLYIDTLANSTMREAFRSVAPLNVSHMSPYFDFVAFVISILVSLILILGTKSHAVINKTYIVFSLILAIFIIFVGATGANSSNWSVKKENISDDVIGGDGGFVPFGVAGVFKGAAVCLYGFLGLDNISTTGKRINAPQQTLPSSVTLAVLIIFLACLGVSTVLSLASPYFETIEVALVAHVVDQLDISWAWWTVTICGIFCLLAGIFTALNPLQHLISSMTADGLLLKSVGYVHPRLGTPFVGLMITGFISALIAALFEVNTLVEMSSIATLVVYIIVAASMLILRYREGPSNDYQYITQNCVESIRLVPFREKKTPVTILKQLINRQKPSLPTPVSSTIVAVEILLFCAVAVVFGVALQYTQHIWAIITSAVTAALAGLLLFCIYIQPMATKSIPFKVPWIPAVPGLCILVNIFLACTLSCRTLIQYAVWMLAGLLLYFLYGIRNSRGIYVMECCVIREPEVRIVIEGPSHRSSRSDSQLVDTETRNQCVPLAEGSLKSNSMISESQFITEPVPISEVTFHSESSTDNVNESATSATEAESEKVATSQGEEYITPNTGSFLYRTGDKFNSSPVNVMENNIVDSEVEIADSPQKKPEVGTQPMHKDPRSVNYEAPVKLRFEMSREKEQSCGSSSLAEQNVFTGKELPEELNMNPVNINNSASTAASVLENTNYSSSINNIDVPNTNGSFKRPNTTSEQYLGRNGEAKKICEKSEIEGGGQYEAQRKDSIMRKNTSSLKRPFSLPNEFNEQKQEPNSEEMKDKEKIKFVLEAMLIARVRESNLPESSNPFQTKPTSLPRQAFSVPSFPLLVNSTENNTDLLPELISPQSPPESPGLVISSIPPPPPLPPPLPSLQLESHKTASSQQEMQPSVTSQEGHSAPTRKTFIPNTDFEYARVQRILMGDMLASIKFLKRREEYGSTEDNIEKGISDNEDEGGDDDVFDSDIKDPKEQKLILSKEQELPEVV